MNELLESSSYNEDNSPFFLEKEYFLSDNFEYLNLKEPEDLILEKSFIENYNHEIIKYSSNEPKNTDDEPTGLTSTKKPSKNFEFEIDKVHDFLLGCEHGPKNEKSKKKRRRYQEPLNRKKNFGKKKER